MLDLEAMKSVVLQAAKRGHVEALHDVADSLIAEVERLRAEVLDLSYTAELTCRREPSDDCPCVACQQYQAHMAIPDEQAMADPGRCIRNGCVVPGTHHNTACRDSLGRAFRLRKPSA